MHQQLYQFILLAFMGFASFSAVLVVLSKNPVRQALFLVLAFILTACIWLMAEAQFLGLILILVYVGAVMTLFLFVVMMTDLENSKVKKSLVFWLPALAVIAGFFTYLIQKFELFIAKGNHTLNASISYSDTKAIGNVLYTDYVYCFELAGALLLVAIVSSISLAFKGVKKGTKQQDVAKQVKVSKKDRLKIVTVGKS